MLRRLAKSEGGFGLVELLIAMAVMSIGITAIVAGYSSGILAVDRAKAGTTAGALADRQMETYRQGSFAAVPPSCGSPRLRRRPERVLDAGRRDLVLRDRHLRRGVSADVHEHAPEPPRQARDDHRPRGLGDAGSSSSPRARPSTPRPADKPSSTQGTDMAAFAYDAINAQGLEISGVVHAPDFGAAREQLQMRGLQPAGAGRAWRRRRAQGRRRVQEGQAEVAAGVRPPVRDDDRGRRQRRRGARHARGADGRQAPGRGDRRRALRDRGRRHPLEGARAAPEGLQPAVRRHGRGRGVVGNARHRARPRRRADREGDADQATRQGSHGLPGGRDHVRVPRAHVHAPLHRPGLRERLRPAARRAAEAHPDRDARCRTRCATGGSSSSPRSARASSRSAA